MGARLSHVPHSFQSSMFCSRVSVVIYRRYCAQSMSVLGHTAISRGRGDRAFAPIGLSMWLSPGPLLSTACYCGAGCMWERPQIGVYVCWVCCIYACMCVYPCVCSALHGVGLTTVESTEHGICVRV